MSESLGLLNSTSKVWDSPGRIEFRFASLCSPWNQPVFHCAGDADHEPLWPARVLTALEAFIQPPPWTKGS